jgi:hypothetical protein
MKTAFSVSPLSSRSKIYRKKTRHASSFFAIALDLQNARWETYVDPPIPRGGLVTRAVAHAA